MALVLRLYQKRHLMRRNLQKNLGLRDEWVMKVSTMCGYAQGKR